MTANKPTYYTDFDEFYDANEPEDAGQLSCLYNSVINLSDETFFSTEIILNKPKAKYHVKAASGDTLKLTEKSYPAFIRFIELKNDSELDIQTAADYEYVMRNPHS